MRVVEPWSIESSLTMESPVADPGPESVGVGWGFESYGAVGTDPDAWLEGASLMAGLWGLCLLERKGMLKPT